MSFLIYKDSVYFEGASTVRRAVEYADEQLSLASQDGELTTFAVCNEDGETVAAVTNRRIVGKMLKQVWSKRDNDEAETIGEETFDATDAVLLLPHSVLINLEDHAPSTDAIGEEHVQWEGPKEVEITDSIREFFGVGDLHDIAEDALTFARERLQPHAPVQRSITLTIRVDVRANSEEALQALANEIEYSVRSRTVGAMVTGSELLEADFAVAARNRP